MQHRARTARSLAALACLAALALAGCKASDGPGAKAAASSLAANPTASADIARIKQIFQPCFDITAAHPVTRAVSCAKDKVPAVQDRKTRRKILGTLASCLLQAYNAAGSWTAFKTGDGWPGCAQAAYNTAVAAGGTPSPAGASGSAA
jgi:hypothetical protein